MFNHDAEPCPMSRCALEWYLAIQAVVVGISVWATADPRLTTEGFNFVLLSISMDAPTWGAWLVLAGILQAAALCVAGKAPQRYAAGLAAFVFGVFSFAAWEGGMTSSAAATGALGAVAEVIVCGMLLGARWRSI